MCRTCAKYSVSLAHTQNNTHILVNRPSAHLRRWMMMNPHCSIGELLIEVLPRLSPINIECGVRITTQHSKQIGDHASIRSRIYQWVHGSEKCPFRGVLPQKTHFLR